MRTPRFLTRTAARIQNTKVRTMSGTTSNSSPFDVEPLDSHIRELMAQLHPLDWVNPKPVSKYNLVIIGAGAAGLSVAVGAAALGAKVALVERHLLGGSHLNVGDIPCNALIRPARFAAEWRRAAMGGLTSTAPSFDFPKIMHRLRRLQTDISRHHSAQRFRDELGVDVFVGDARFAEPDRVEVDGRKLHFAKAVVATGSRLKQPSLPGLQEIGYLTHESIFHLNHLPPRLLIIGGGPIGCELAQALHRLGSQVTLIQNHRLLPREDEETSSLLQRIFEREGIHVLIHADIKKVFVQQGLKTLYVEVNGKIQTVEGDELLISTGRTPNVDGLNLEEANVRYDPKFGIQTNDFLQTTNANVYAAGDVCTNWKFTHAANAAARIVIQNALFKGKARLSQLIMPWCTYTDPEIAHVGLYEWEARQAGLRLDTFTVDLRDVDRALTDDEAEGFLKIHVLHRKDRVAGATWVATHAGEMINQITTAITGQVSLRALADVIYPYPTQAEAFKKAVDAYGRTRLTPNTRWILGKWLSWQRR
jgi:pyruvate/2-oxoglutarate dehydrogenase complex dihydrolipoamide dehydrogenase (E3) component